MSWLNLTMVMQSHPWFLVHQDCFSNDQSSESIADKSKRPCLKGGKGAKEIASVKFRKNYLTAHWFPPALVDFGFKNCFWYAYHCLLFKLICLNIFEGEGFFNRNVPNVFCFFFQLQTNWGVCWSMNNVNIQFQESFIA